MRRERDPLDENTQIKAGSVGAVLRWGVALVLGYLTVYTNVNDRIRHLEDVVDMANIDELPKALGRIEEKLDHIEKQQDKDGRR